MAFSDRLTAPSTAALKDRLAGMTRSLAADPWLVVAIAAAGLGLVGGAVAVAELAAGPGAAARRVGVPITTVRFDPVDLRPALVPAAIPTERAALAAVVVPPSGRFVGASAVPAGMATGDAFAGPSRFSAAFEPFGAVGPKIVLASASATILPPVPGDAALAPIVAAVTAVPDQVARAVADPRLPTARPRPKPADLARAPDTGGVGGPLVVASLSVPTPDTSPASSAAGAVPILADAPRKVPKGAGPFLEIIKREAKANRVPLWLALGLIWVESKYDPNLRGSHGVLGLMQVMPSTARYLGYKGTDADLLKPEVNVKWGMKELAKDLNYAGGEVCLTAAKYKGGFLTKRINAGAQRYCDLMRKVTGMEHVEKVPMPGSVAAMPKTARRS